MEELAAVLTPVERSGCQTFDPVMQGQTQATMREAGRCPMPCAAALSELWPLCLEGAGQTSWLDLALSEGGTSTIDMKQEVREAATVQGELASQSPPVPQSLAPEWGMIGCKMAMRM